VSSEVVKKLATAMESARDRATFPQARSAALSSDGVIALASETNMEFRSAATGKLIDQVEDTGAGGCTFSQCVKFSPDDKIVSFAGFTGIFLWTRAAHRGRVILPTDDGFPATSFSPHSNRIVAITSAGMILVSTVSGQQISKDPMRGMPQATEAMAEARSKNPRVDIDFQVAILFVSDTQGFIALGSGDKVYLSDLTGKLLAPPFEGHRHPITSIALSLDPNKQLIIVSGDQEGNMLMWDDKGKLTQDPIRPHSGLISALAINPQGDMIISAGVNAAINFSTLTGRSATTPVGGFPKLVRGLAFSPDGNQLLAMSDETKLIDTYGIRIPSSRPSDGRNTFPTAVAVGNQGTVVVGYVDNSILLWHPPTGFERRIELASTSPIDGLAFTADESILASKSHDGELRLWDRNCDPMGDPWVNVVAFDLDPEGKFLLIASGDSLELIDIQSRTELQKVTEDGTSGITSVRFASDRSQGIRFTTASKNKIQSWAIRSQKIEQAGVPDIPILDGWTPFLGPNDKAFVLGNDHGEIQLVRADGSKSAKPLDPHDSGEKVIGAITFPDGETTASIVQGTQNVALCRFVGTDDCVPVSVTGHRGGITTIAISPDGKTLVSAGFDKTLRMLRPDWTSWLAISCNRLRNLGVFEDPKFSDIAHLDSKLVQETEETFKSMVWDKQ